MAPLKGTFLFEFALWFCWSCKHKLNVNWGFKMCGGDVSLKFGGNWKILIVNSGINEMVSY